MSRPRQSVTHLPIEAVQPHPGNIRDEIGDVTEMAASIREHGILQPLIVTEHPDRQDTFLLLAGHRRRAAAAAAGMTQVPCIIRHDLGGEGAEHLALMLVENGHRRQLTPLEKARAIGRLLEMGLSQTDVARATGLRPSTVNTHALLLELDEETTEAVESGEITASEARDAVRSARQKRRTAGGTPTRGRPIVVEPAYLTVHHSLAQSVKDGCDHTTRPLVGSIGCGQCWEAAIVRAALGGVPA